jgi:hypothetical protein
LWRARGFGHSNLKNGEKQLCAKLPDGRSIAEPVRAGIVTLTYLTHGPRPIHRYIEYSLAMPSGGPLTPRGLVQRARNEG